MKTMWKKINNLSMNIKTITVLILVAVWLALL